MTLDDLHNIIIDRFDAIDKRFDGMDTRLRSVETDCVIKKRLWIKGKLEGRGERRGWVFNIVTASAAIAAVIVALIALLK